MLNQRSRKVLAVLEDLLFNVKIGDAAKRTGLEAEFVKTDKDALLRAKELSPLVVIIDLNCSSAQPIRLITKFKDGELKEIPLIAFVSHVQGDLKQKAHEAGCDMVLARSAFSQNLPQILKRHAGIG
jgi:CheY-like chemotaxis protein